MIAAHPLVYIGIAWVALSIPVSICLGQLLKKRSAELGDYEEDQ